MSDLDLDPLGRSLREARNHWKEENDAAERIFFTMLETTEYTHHSTISENADCAPNTAKKYLDRLVIMGPVERRPRGNPAYYRRNDAHFEWREACRIAMELEEGEISEQVGMLHSRKVQLEEKFEFDGPNEIPVIESHPYTPQEKLEKRKEWNRVKRNLEVYQVAYRLSLKDGHLLSR